jgi:hypothetical protein
MRGPHHFWRERKFKILIAKPQGKNPLERMKPKWNNVELANHHYYCVALGHSVPFMPNIVFVS